ncbi:FAD-binding oxidoreductase [Nocardia altamirensis]|uniref:FAD-binding oxidoreductase n=1 Tax=Nocardia altamirensis TaxID=472158 RepID=UPI000B2746CB|nr:FAD-binding oxidoreductase [Nocardia altamirensis]
MNSRILRLRGEREPGPFLDTLRDIVGPAHVLTDPATTRGYTTDWTGRWAGSAVAVVRPASTAEVSDVTAACFKALVPITAQGGNTGLVGGGIPESGSIVLSTRRLDRVEAVDPIGRTIAAGAGVTVAGADQAASVHGLRFGVDLASKTSATLGGIVATNAGGARMIRNGDTRSQLLGIEAVLADGFVLSRWTSLCKDNVGYDLPGLLTGSEGTLAVITRVLMKLSTPPADAHVFLAGVATIDAALRLYDRVVRSGLTVEAAELMTEDGIDLVCTHTGAKRPFDTHSPVLALFEVSAHRDTEAAVVEILSASEDLIDNAVMDPPPARRLWQLRESHTESIGRESSTPVVKLDVSIPLGSMTSFVRDLESSLAQHHPAVRAILFGHFVDGNIHVNLLDVAKDDVDSLTDGVFSLVADHEGSISAEHGIGRAKNSWVHLGRTPIDVHTMNRIKFALDPRRILNPGVLFPR